MLIVLTIINIYLEHGADLTATNNEGHTALSLAVGVGNKNGESLVEKKIAAKQSLRQPQKKFTV